MIPFLRRLEEIEPENDDEEESNPRINNMTPFTSATEAFLRYLEYPEDENVSIDLQQSAVVIMSHLDRLAAPHQPPVVHENDRTLPENSGKNLPNLIWAGQVSWNVFMESSVNDEGNFAMANIFGHICPKNVVLSSKGLVGLTLEGKLFTLNFNGEQKMVQFPKVDFVFSKICCSVDGSSMCALDQSESVFVHWEFQNDPHVSFDQPYDILR